MASVAPDVKTTPLGGAVRSAATSRLAFVTEANPSRPRSRGDLLGQVELTFLVLFLLFFLYRLGLIYHALVVLAGEDE